ncbi:MAG TPA: hypothetical protein P5572_02925 [Phycisphaerae bacterium]|nr:hypothetical protein [Phycisphaerae bacterium]
MAQSLSVLSALVCAAGVVSPAHWAQAADEPPDIATVAPDLAPPPVEAGAPAAGKRVRQQLPAWADTDVHHCLYLPTDWKPGSKYPVIVEYTGNGPYHNKYGDTCSGRIEDAVLGYGLSGGAGFIWLTLPCVDRARGCNALSWWGDVDATVAYCEAAVKLVCADYGGDASAVVLMGFSRGAIACNYIGLHDDSISRLWCAFLPDSHYDGVREWPYPDSDRASALVRLRRLGERPTLVIQENSTAATEAYLRAADTDAPFDFCTTGFRNHTDQWVLRDVPARAAARKWLHAVTAGHAREGQPTGGAPP